MDQTVISTFKGNYLKHVMKGMVDFTKITQDDCVVVVKNFWKKFSVLDAIDYVNKSLKIQFWTGAGSSYCQKWF